MSVIFLVDGGKGTLDRSNGIDKISILYTRFCQNPDLEIKRVEIAVLSCKVCFESVRFFIQVTSLDYLTILPDCLTM